MALRNAFEGLALDSTLRKLVNQLHFARDSLDRLRIVADGGHVHTTTYWGASNGATIWYSTGAPTSMDDRENHRMMSRQTAMMSRQKWIIS